MGDLLENSVKTGEMWRKIHTAHCGEGEGVSLEEKRSFLLYNDYGEQFILLSDEDAGKVVKALFAHENGEPEPVLEGAARMLFSIVCRDLDRNRERYNARCAQNRENGAKGGRPKKRESEGFSPEPDTNRGKAKKADTDTDTDTETDTETEKETERQRQTGAAGASSLTEPVSLIEPSSLTEPASPKELASPAETVCESVPSESSCLKDVPLEEYRKIWLQCCPSLPAPQEAASWTAARVRALREKHVTLEGWQKACEQMEQSDFLTGRAEPGGGRRAPAWKCSIDWALKPANWQKILEGTYGGKAEDKAQGRSFDLDEWEHLNDFFDF